MRDKFLIFSIASMIIFFLGFIAHIQYFQTKGNLIKLYSEKQATLALQAATSLESYIKERIKAIEILAEMPPTIKSNQEMYLSEFIKTYNIVKGFQHIFYVDTTGIAVFGYPEGYPCPTDQPEEIQEKFKATFYQAIDLQKTVAFERNILIDGKVTVCLIIPIFAADNKFVGAIIGSLDIREALYDALQPIMVGSGDHAWVINEPGYLIYNPAHEEMLIQNVFKANDECFKCHVEFNMEKEMLSTKRGVGIKNNLKLPTQLVGYAQVHLENTYWIVAISTPFEMITISLRSEFRNFLLLIIVIIVTILFGAFLVNRINSENITTKKELENLKAQAQLVQQKNAAESRYRILVEQSPDPIFLCTRLKPIMVNKSFEQLFGYIQDEVCNEQFSIIDLIDQKSVHQYKSEIAALIKGQKQIASINIGMRNKAGEFLSVEISLGRFLFDQQVVYQGIVHDITKIKQLEREREQKKHLAIIGEMSARIAHEIKNPLASIQTGIQLLESQIVENNYLRTYYERLRGEIQRVDKILKGLLTYAREDHLELKTIKIDPLIKRFEGVFRPTALKQKIELMVKLDENLPEIQIDEHKLEQVLWNLCLNAIQASNPGDTIAIEARKDSGGVNIVIRDQGSGIPDELSEKIFHPFFSTRTHGSGLGLAISKKIIELHGGRLTVSSKLDEGTSVTISLPKEELSRVSIGFEKKKCTD